MITGVVVALVNEINTLTDKKISKGECIFINETTLVAFSGAGAENATRASQLLISKGAERLISWGCAAGLKANLHPGDLVLPSTLYTATQDQLSIDSSWLQDVLERLSGLQPFTGSLAESDRMVTESSAKKIFHRQTRAIALDMESIAIAKTAIKNNIPILVIRTIADPVTMNLPQAVSYALNDQGDVVMTKLVWFLLTHPTELSNLIKLGIHFHAAKNKLKLVAKQLDIIDGFEQNKAIK